MTQGEADVGSSHTYVCTHTLITIVVTALKGRISSEELGRSSLERVFSNT